MIPKIIHTCWFSNEEFPDDIRRCMNTWKTKLPEYEIRIWNSDILKEPDIMNCAYVMEAIKAKKWAFASDFIRLFVLYKYGGIYLDSDIEVLKSFDDILDQRAFTGFEDDKNISAWIFGSEKSNALFMEVLEDYKDRHFIKDNGNYDLTPNPIPITKRLVGHGLDFSKCDTVQRLDSITIYPMDYFCPFNPRRQGNDLFTDNTICNHHFSGAWRPVNEQFSMNLEMKLRKVLGYRLAHSLMLPFFVYNRVKADGIIETLKYIGTKISSN